MKLGNYKFTIQQGGLVDRLLSIPKDIVKGIWITRWFWGSCLGYLAFFMAVVAIDTVFGTKVVLLVLVLILVTIFLALFHSVGSNSP